VGYHEDRYIEYLGERDGQIFGGEPGRALREEPELFGVTQVIPLGGLGIPRTHSNRPRRRTATMSKKAVARKTVAAPGQGKKEATMRNVRATDKKIAREQKRHDKKIASLQKKQAAVNEKSAKKVAKLQTRIDKILAKFAAKTKKTAAKK